MNTRHAMPAVHPVYDFENNEPTRLTGLTAKLLTGKQMFDIAVQTMTDYTDVMGPDGDGPTLGLLNQALTILATLAGIDELELAATKQRINEGKNEPTDGLGTISPDACIETLCSLHKLSVGLNEEFEQDVLLDFGIFLAEFYDSWHDETA